MELQHFFRPAVYPKGAHPALPIGLSFRRQIQVIETSDQWEALEKYRVVLFGVGEERATANKGTELAPSSIRARLAELVAIADVPMADLGDFRLGDTHNDTLIGLQHVLQELLRMGLLPIVLGGSSELLLSLVAAVGSQDHDLGLTLIDPRVDVVAREERLSSYNYLHTLLENHLDTLFSVSIIGLQAYYNSTKALHIVEDLLFDLYRLGQAQDNLRLLEPVLRDTNVLSIDLSAVRQSDAPGHRFASVNGFYAQEICQLAKYAGMSDRLTALGIFEHNPVFDTQQQSAALVAQIIWHFVEGVSLRQNDFPTNEAKHYTKFIVQLEESNNELCFYKNTRNGRWWAEVVVNPESPKQHRIVACNEADYQLAAQNQIPDLWWRTLQKMNRKRSAN